MSNQSKALVDVHPSLWRRKHPVRLNSTDNMPIEEDTLFFKWLAYFEENPNALMDLGLGLMCVSSFVIGFTLALLGAIWLFA